MLEQDVHTLQVQCAIPSCGQGPGEILEVPDATNFADARMRIQCRFDITVTTKDVLCTAHWASFNRAPRNIKCCDQGRVLLPILGGAQPKRHLWARPPPTGYTIGFLAILFDDLLVLRKNLFYDGIHEVCAKNI